MAIKGIMFWIFPTSTDFKFACPNILQILGQAQKQIWLLTNLGLLTILILNENDNFWKLKCKNIS